MLNDFSIIRDQFPILSQMVNGKRLVYLDSAASSQIPRCVIDAFVHHYNNDHSNIHRGIHTLAERSTEGYEGARGKVAKFIGADPDEIVFTRGSTESCNLVAYSLLPTFDPGDQVLATEMDHHSNFVAWQQLSKRYDLRFKAIPVRSDYTLDINALQELLTERTRIVTIPHVSNVLGTVNPVQEIAKMVHGAGALLYVDGAQSIAHMPVNVRQVGADFYGFSGHKMYAPTGIGALYARRDILNTLQPFHYGGGMIDDVSVEETRFADVPSRLEAGTPNIVGAICLGAAVDFLTRIGMENVERHEYDLTQRLVDQLWNVPGIRMIGPLAGHRVGVVSLEIQGIHAHDVSSAMDEEGIAIRAGHHCAQPLGKRFGVSATARASVGIYTTIEEVDVFAKAASRIAREVKEGAADRSSLVIGELTEEERVCRDRMLEHCKNPHNKRKSEGASACMNGVNPACGDSLTVCLKVVDSKIIDASYEGYGCAISEASTSILIESIIGKEVGEVRSLTREDMLGMLGVPIGILKMKCALLGLRTTQTALNECSDTSIGK